MASATIYCRTTNKGIQSFYLKMDNEKYYLFSQTYRKGVHDYYTNGVRLDNALDHTKSKKDSAISRTMDKIPKYISYIEKEYKIAVFDKTIKQMKRIA